MVRSEHIDNLFESVIDKVRRRETFSPLYKVVARVLTPAQTVPEEINIAGFYFQVIDAPTSATFINVRFNEESADPVPVRKGDEIVTPFYRVFVDWPAQAGTLTFVISPLFDLWRINRTAEIAASLPIPVTPGEDFWLQEIRAGRAFFAGEFKGGVAATITQIQILNPAGSGIKVLLKHAVVSVGTTTSIIQFSHNVLIAGSVIVGKNLLIDSPASVALVRIDRITGGVAEPGGGSPTVTALPNTPTRFIPEWLVELAPGKGFLIRTVSSDIDFGFIFYWTEKAV